MWEYDATIRIGTRRLRPRSRDDAVLVASGVCESSPPMNHTDSRHDPEESRPIDDRYAAVSMADGHMLYDTENPAAWITSDITLDPERAGIDDVYAVRLLGALRV